MVLLPMACLSVGLPVYIGMLRVCVCVLVHVQRMGPRIPYVLLLLSQS